MCREMMAMEHQTFAITLKLAKETAVEAALAAGRLIRKQFDEVIVPEWKSEDGDIVTATDRASEAVILARIGSAFPNHAVRSEETGWNGVEADWLWLIDPLDGTNNFAVGLPVFGTSITLIYKGIPQLGVIYDPVLDKLYVGEKGAGSFCNGVPMRAAAVESLPVRRMTVGWIQGHHVQKKDEAMRLKRHLDERFKRSLRLWAPSLLWSGLARGDLDAVILYNSEGDDLYSGILLAEEAGIEVNDFQGRPFTGMNAEPYIVAAHPMNMAAVLQIVKEIVG
jgi:myo-inositol-1(or 4)-monophosphatase